jgi:hypothetical protein
MRLLRYRLTGQPRSLCEVRTKLRSMAPYMVSHKTHWGKQLGKEESNIFTREQSTKTKRN